jgi:hypothetical protein
MGRGRGERREKNSELQLPTLNIELQEPRSNRRDVEISKMADGDGRWPKRKLKEPEGASRKRLTRISFRALHP